MAGLCSCAEDYYVYGIDDLEITPVNSDKDKAKTHSQYISILYTNMFQRALGPNKMLEALNAIDPEGAAIVQMRFFGDLLNEDIATTLGLSLRTVERSWRAARAWLLDRLEAK